MTTTTASVVPMTRVVSDSMQGFARVVGDSKATTRVVGDRNRDRKDGPDSSTQAHSDLVTDSHTGPYEMCILTPDAAGTSDTASQRRH